MKRAVAFAIATAALAAATGCGATHRVVSSRSPIRLVPPSPTALRFSTAANRRFAHEDVQRLMRILALPRGARLVAKVPRGAPPRFDSEFTRTGFLRGIAITHRIWVVHQPLERVVRFARAHARPRPRPEARFRGKNNGVQFRPVGSYSFPPVPGRSWQRWLNVDMTALSGGGTAVIAQAGDAWVRTPRRALVPAGVRRIDVVSRVGSHRPNVLVHVRSPYEVGSIVSLVNGLGLADVEHTACLLVLVGGPTVTLRLRAASGTLLARATVRNTLGRGTSGPCNPLQLTVHGAKAPPLIGADLLLRIQRLLDVDLAPPLPREVSDCLLHRHGWKVQSVTHNQMVGRVRHFPVELTATKNGRRWTITLHSTGKVTLDKAAPRGLEHCLHGGGGR